MNQKVSLLERIVIYGRMIKFSHTVFALPFALAAVILAGRDYPVTLRDFFWILVAMVGARSAAMGFNRITDARFDAANPRTATREIPSGKLSLISAVIFVILFSGLFVFAAAMLGSLCFYLSFPMLAVLLFYSWTKRFTWTAHLWLGFAISLAPVGAWIAVAKSFSPDILLLSLALMTHIAGFDVLYACQDADFDRSQGLFSIPSRFGVKTAMRIAALIHCIAYGFFISIYIAFDMTGAYLLAVGIIGALLVTEHALVDPDDLRHIHIAFFHINSIVSVVLLLGVAGDALLRQVV